jgi:cytidylate kinase
VVIAIDGPGGVGKSSVARAIAEALDLPHLDTGATYRAAALAVLRRGGDPLDAEAAVDAIEGTSLDFQNGSVFLDGEDVTAEIRSAGATAGSSAVAAHPGVRKRIVDLQRRWVDAHGGSAVVEGRDIGTVVFPDAAVKIYLTASPEVRAARRAGDEESGGRSVEEIAAELRARDHADSTRATSPLRPADDAVVIETDGLSEEEVIDAALRLVDAAAAP